jgi:hypothetical protein
MACLMEQRTRVFSAAATGAQPQPQIPLPLRAVADLEQNLWGGNLQTEMEILFETPNYMTQTS